jgi:ABC-type lipoprotein export system ATPase subunit/CRP-like cAMP-binding protein
VVALNGIDLRVERGEFVAVIGKSGSGKSTFINMLTGIDRPTEGEVLVGGTPLHLLDESSLSRWRGRHLGIVFQFFQMLPTLTLLENIVLPMELNGMFAARARRERAQHLLELVQLGDQANKMPSAVSGGQQQRAAIARALANEPSLIIADEPTGSLDSKTAGQIFDLFRQLAASGTTILMVTHDDDLARRVDRAILIADGEVVHEHLVRALKEISHDELVAVKRSATQRRFLPGATITRQGEVDQEFCILLEGHVDVLVERPGGGETLVDRLSPGQWFGEAALTGHGVRTATVRAADDCSVLVAALDAAAFQRIIDSSPALRERLDQVVEHQQIHRRLQALEALDLSALTAITHDLRSQTFQPGETILRQGALGDSFFFLLEGTVAVTLRRPDGTETVLREQHAGEYFGELALLGDGRRTANVKALREPVRVVELSRADFDEVTARSPSFRQEVERLAAPRRLAGDASADLA